MKKSVIFGLSFLSGILLWAAWPVSPLTFIIFIALIPLLHLADKIEKKRLFFFLAFLAMLTWNAASTWWIWNATDAGSIAAIIANSLIMCLPLWGYRVCKRRFGRRMGYVSLVLFWMAFEYIHLNWQLSWPWLTIGNVFAGQPNWVQWYEFTGTSGGTLWVLVANILLFEAWISVQGKTLTTKKTLVPATVLLVPIVLSYMLIPAKQQNLPSTNVVIVQPNIDPYTKFAEDSAGPQVQHLLQLTNSAVDSNTRLVLWPETALTRRGSVEEQVGLYPEYQPAFAFAGQHPNITILSGIEIFKIYGPEKRTPTARFNGVYYDDFNAAITIKQGAPVKFYHKSKLVPGVETLPTFLNFMAPVFEQFGGTTGGYGRQDESSIMQQPGQPYVVAPIICYESIYGEYVSTYVKKGANILAIITNDGWWGNTPGHKQHLQYARLRAIETRRWVARSANTGISAVIDNRGEIIETRSWDKTAVLKFNIPIATVQTFYVRFGDILSKAALALACAFFLWNLVLWVKKRFSR